MTASRFVAAALLAFSLNASAQKVPSAGAEAPSGVAPEAPEAGVDPSATPPAAEVPVVHAAAEPAAEPVVEAAAEPAAAPKPVQAAASATPGWLKNLAPLALLLVAVAVVFSRLPKVEGLSHLTPEFARRRLMNWLPLGLTYSFMYMGRYNLQVSKGAFETMMAPDGSALMGNDDFGMIFGIGTAVYGFSFIINGPLTDRFGGRRTMLIGTLGVVAVNAAMGVATWLLLQKGALAAPIAASFVPVFATLYAINMYFQSFGAVAVVKVNAPWFHVRERGVFGAIFGILISLGLYFAYDWSYLILKNVGLTWVFVIPAALLALLWVLDLLLVRDRPGLAGLADFSTGDATSGEEGGPSVGALHVFKLMIRNPIIMTIAFVEFSSGFLRQAIMQWYRTFAKQTDGVLGLTDSFVYENWGLLLCVAGILGGMVAGIISDRVFGSRRGPVAALLYGVMLVSAVVMTFAYATPLVSFLVLFMSMAVIGVHGMLSGTASMDFGGSKNVGVAVGIIDGFVYLGTAVMSFTYAMVLPRESFDAAGKLVGDATDPAKWIGWPVSMIPLAMLGTFLALRLWNAKPSGRGH